MKVKIFDLQKEFELMREQFHSLFDTSAGSGEYVLGKEVAAFERAFAAYVGTGHAVGVGSGTDAIRIGGLACGLRPGDKVITTPNTYVATVMALSPHGIASVLCDIDSETYTMDPAGLEGVLKKEKGVRLCVPVHLYGHPCMMDEIREVCGKYGVPIFEDACQAHGALYKGTKTGSLGMASAFSFYPTKNLGCFGDGGAVTTDDEGVFRRAQALRNYGQEEKHVHLMEGFNSRLDEIQAALLSYKLTLLDGFNDARRHIADLYQKELGNTPLVLPVEKPWAHHVYHLFVIRTTRRDELMEYLKQKGIGTLIHYPTPIHLQPAYAHLGYRPGDFPHAEKASKEIVSLPCYPTLRDEEVLYVCDALRSFFGS